MRCTLLQARLLLTAAVCVAWLGQAAAADEDFTTLFNGKNFNGFKFVLGGKDAEPGETFKVVDDVIVVSGQPNGYIQTAVPYKNYHLKFDLKYPKAAGNSGVLIHIQGLPEKGAWPKCVEAQGMNKDMGNLFSIGGAPKGEFKKYGEEQQKAIKPVGEWNTYEVISKDGTLTTLINGTKVSEGTSELKEGPIGWQSEGVEIHFRNLRIKEMK